MGYYDIVRSVPGGTVKNPKPKKPKKYNNKLACKLNITTSFELLSPLSKKVSGLPKKTRTTRMAKSY